MSDRTGVLAYRSLDEIPDPVELAERYEQDGMFVPRAGAAFLARLAKVSAALA